MAYTATVPELMRKYSTTDLDNAFTLFDSDKDKPADLRARWTVPAWAGAGIASLVENATGRELVKQGGHVLG